MSEWHPDLPESCRNQIVTGDARVVLATFPPESVGCILTSPPYNVGLAYDGYDDNLPDDEFQEFNRAWLTEAYRVAANGARAYVIVSDKMLWWFRDLAITAGWRFAQLLTWCKPNLVGAGRIGADWHHMSEPILLFRKGSRTPMLADHGNCTFNWFVETTPQRNFTDGRIHPAQLPLSLCLKILARTPGSPVLDPFAGSGSVLVAARRLGRVYLGMELVPTVAERARVRLANTQWPAPELLPEQLALEVVGC